MNRFFKLSFFIILSIIHYQSIAQYNYYSLDQNEALTSSITDLEAHVSGSSNWATVSSKANWDLDDVTAKITVPTDDQNALDTYLNSWEGDILTIKEGIALTFGDGNGSSDDFTYDGLDPVLIIIAGSITFENKASLTLPPGSSLIILSTGSLNSNKLNGANTPEIVVDTGGAGTPIWDGSDPALGGDGSIDGSTTGSQIIDQDNPAGTDTPLPVQLINFNLKQEEGKIILDWTTATEINTKRFDVERSIDGINFERVSAVDAIGESQSLVNYQYIDQNVLTGYVYFYRLNMVDNDYSNQYSKSQMIQLDASDLNIKFYPNPVIDQLSISDIKGGLSEVTIYSKEGHKVFHAKTDDHFRETLDLSGLNTGLYILSVKTSTDHQTYRFIKQ
ncbi:T9SS type A sorting domain-containing protein [Sediminitomix flava]|nr:T9SS type A sorting domain-containing protein [Sediminitomix flava]